MGCGAKLGALWGQMGRKGRKAAPCQEDIKSQGTGLVLMCGKGIGFWGETDLDLTLTLHLPFIVLGCTSLDSLSLSFLDCKMGLSYSFHRHVNIR